LRLLGNRGSFLNRRRRRAEIRGRREAFGEFMELLDTFPAWFNTVTP